MNRHLILAARVALSALLLGLILIQVLLPFLAREVGGQFEETVALVAPYAAAAIIAVLCIQLSLVVAWWFLSRVDAGTFFSEPSVRGMNIIIVSAFLAFAIPAAVALHLLVIVGVGGPGFVVGAGALLVGGAATTLILIITKGLLRSAIIDHQQLSEVI